MLSSVTDCKGGVVEELNRGPTVKEAEIGVILKGGYVCLAGRGLDRGRRPEPFHLCDFQRATERIQVHSTLEPCVSQNALDG